MSSTDILLGPKDHEICILLWRSFFFYCPLTKFAKAMFLHLSIILFKGGGGGYCIQRRGLHPGGQHLRGSAFRGRVGKTPFPHRILQDTVNERAVHILLECILVSLHIRSM